MTLTHNLVHRESCQHRHVEPHRDDIGTVICLRCDRVLYRRDLKAKPLHSLLVDLDYPPLS